jgi:hypothetical protein
MVEDGVIVSGTIAIGAGVGAVQAVSRTASKVINRVFFMKCLLFRVTNPDPKGFLTGGNL